MASPSVLYAIRARPFPYPRSIVHLDFIGQRYWWNGRQRQTANFTTFTLGNGKLDQSGLTPGSTTDISIATSGIGTLVPGAYLVTVRQNSAPAGTLAVFGLDDGTTTNRVTCSQTTTPSLNLTVVTGNVSQCSIGTGAVVSATNRYFNTAASYQTNLFDCSSNGHLGTQDTAGSLPTVTTLRVARLSSGGGSETTGSIAAIVLFDSPRTPPELQAMSVGPLLSMAA